MSPFINPEALPVSEVGTYWHAAGLQAEALAGRAVHIGLNLASALLPAVGLYYAFKFVGKGLER